MSDPLIYLISLNISNTFKKEYKHIVHHNDYKTFFSKLNSKKVNTNGFYVFHN